MFSLFSCRGLLCFSSQHEALAFVAQFNDIIIVVVIIFSINIDNRFISISMSVDILSQINRFAHRIQPPNTAIAVTIIDLSRVPMGSYPLLLYFLGIY